MRSNSGALREVGLPSTTTLLVYQTLDRLDVCDQDLDTETTVATFVSLEIRRICVHQSFIVTLSLDTRLFLIG